MKEAVDFTKPEAIEADLLAAVADAAAPKEKKAPKPRMVTCPNCGTAFELPKSLAARGVVSGIALEDMTDEQLKIEYRNANSVFYKTKKNPASKPESIERTTARLDAVKAIMDTRGIAPTGKTQEITAANVADMIKAGKIDLDALQALLDAR